MGKKKGATGPRTKGDEASRVPAETAFAAAQEGHVEALRALRDLGCLIAEKAINGSTAAFLAAEAGHVVAFFPIHSERTLGVAAKRCT